MNGAIFPGATVEFRGLQYRCTSLSDKKNDGRAFTAISNLELEHESVVPGE
jgi:hypothetical protein